MPKNRKNSDTSDSDSGPDDSQIIEKLTTIEVTVEEMRLVNQKTNEKLQELSVIQADTNAQLLKLLQDVRDMKGCKQKQPAKKAKTSKKESKEERHSWQLEKMKFVKVREFKGKVMVDIREFYEKDGDLLPGRKGISLSAAQWKKLTGLVDDVNAALEEY